MRSSSPPPLRSRFNRVLFTPDRGSRNGLAFGILTKALGNIFDTSVFRRVVCFRPQRKTPSRIASLAAKNSASNVVEELTIISNIIDSHGGPGGISYDWFPIFGGEHCEEIMEHFKKNVSNKKFITVVERSYELVVNGGTIGKLSTSISLTLIHISRSQRLIFGSMETSKYGHQTLNLGIIGKGYN